MKVYNKDKTKIIDVYDLTLGYLVKDEIIRIEPEVLAVEEQGHYEIIAEYPNGSKDFVWVVDVEGVEYSPETEVKEDVYIYVPYTPEELHTKEIERFREIRQCECFDIINRGVLWYNTLTEIQIQELNGWYQSWLDVTDTMIIPEKPTWLK